MIAVAATALAQHGTAPSNYYPQNYGGSTFTGIVTSTNSDQITLSYAKGSKTEVFAGRLETGCSVPTKDKSDVKLHAADVPSGTVLTAFYNVVSRKVDGKKIEENVIIAISMVVWNGARIPEDKRKIYLCTEQTNLVLRFWGAER